MNTKSLIIKSGSKNKSIHSYILKVITEMKNYEKIELVASETNINKLVTILEILKRKLTNLNHTLDINRNSNKEATLTVTLIINSEFLSQNEENFKSNIFNINF